mmetsp:Transcript_21222/g.50157  ORF Transcript_21222/g.50157 Transcript_21222/m.50157 type:complete len:106 (+) Transcript_21222:160-477(+)
MPVNAQDTTERLVDIRTRENKSPLTPDFSSCVSFSYSYFDHPIMLVSLTVEVASKRPGRLTSNENRVSTPHSLLAFSNKREQNRSSTPLYQWRAGGKARRATAMV